MSKSTFHKFGKFIIVGGSGAILQMTITYLFTEFLGFHYLISLGVAIGGVTIWNFIWNLKWTFK